MKLWVIARVASCGRGGVGGMLSLFRRYMVLVRGKSACERTNL